MNMLVVDLFTMPLEEDFAVVQWHVHAGIRSWMLKCACTVVLLAFVFFFCTSCQGNSRFLLSVEVVYLTVCHTYSRWPSTRIPFDCFFFTGLECSNSRFDILVGCGVWGGVFKMQNVLKASTPNALPMECDVHFCTLAAALPLKSEDCRRPCCWRHGLCSRPGILLSGKIAVLHGGSSKVQ